MPLAEYACCRMFAGMDLLRIYQCFCDRTRLRLLNLLLQGPLCVCHLQEVLREPQVKISKHLAYLKERGLVEAERCGTWMIYRLPDKRPAQLAANLACLQDCAGEERLFRDDVARLKKVRAGFDAQTPSCVRQPGATCS